MSNVFFVSDTHWGHKNILNFEPYHRPFDTIEEHDQVLIDNWNSVVNKKDIVYHLGDVVFGKENMKKLGLLNGDKRLIMGNHDCYVTSDYLRYFTKLHGCLQWQGFCLLTHVPVNPQQLGNRFKYNIHGHLHSKNVTLPQLEGKEAYINDLRYINVSVEQINLTPISWDDLKDKYMEKN